MFRHQELPLITKQFYNKKNQLTKKQYRLTNLRPFLENENCFYTNVIDIEASKKLTYKQISKNKNLCKEKILEEIQNQEAMKSQPNFIHLHDVFEDKENIYMLLEQHHSTVLQILNSRKKLLHREVQYLLHQLIAILCGLRKHNIAHGNISLSELYIEPETMKLKLGGFNKSLNIEKLTKRNNKSSSSNFDPNEYSSPEFLGHNTEDYERYYCDDIWSLGVILYFLLTGKHPYLHFDEKKRVGTPAIQKIKRCSFQFPRYQCIENGWKQLIKRIFQPKQKRITLAELINHEYHYCPEKIPMELNHNILPSINYHYLEFYESYEPSRFTESWRLNFPQNKKKVIQWRIQLLDEEKKQFLTKIFDKKQRIPLIVSEPNKIIKFYADEKYLGYLLDNIIGVLDENGDCIIGRNDEEFMYSKMRNSSEYGDQEEDGQRGEKNAEIYSSYLRGKVPSPLYQKYQEFLLEYGQRVTILSSEWFSVWIVWYWKFDNVIMFLFSNGAWQMSFINDKSRYVIIDAHQLCWIEGDRNHDQLERLARRFIAKIKYQFHSQKY